MSLLVCRSKRYFLFCRPICVKYLVDIAKLSGCSSHTTFFDSVKPTKADGECKMMESEKYAKILPFSTSPPEHRNLGANNATHVLFDSALQEESRPYFIASHRRYSVVAAFPLPSSPFPNMLLKTSASLLLRRAAAPALRRAADCSRCLDGPHQHCCGALVQHHGLDGKWNENVHEPLPGGILRWW